MRQRKYTKEVLEDAISKCTSVRQIIFFFGLSETGGNYSNFAKLIKRFDLNVDHFVGQGWAKGSTRETNESVDKVARQLEIPEEIILTKNSQCAISSTRLRKILKKKKQYICHICNSPPIWQGKYLTLHMDHINGNNNDHRLENLRFLCPNCHQQTPTWGKNKPKKC